MAAAKTSSDADTKALTAWKVTDTQENANKYDVCVNPIPVSVKISVTALGNGNFYTTDQMVKGIYGANQIIPNNSQSGTQPTTLAPNTYKLTAHNDLRNLNNYKFRISDRNMQNPVLSDVVNWPFLLVIEQGDTEITIILENAYYERTGF